jgi:hypothetical protein
MSEACDLGKSRSDFIAVRPDFKVLLQYYSSCHGMQKSLRGLIKAAVPRIVFRADGLDQKLETKQLDERMGRYYRR